eukprot:scaffold441429_cov20-Prasinocladus_malaysianus.AAC.1
MEADWATAMHNYSVLLRQDGRWQDAETICEAVVAMREKVLGAEHSQVGEAKAVLAGIRQMQKHFFEAEALYRDAVRLMRRRRATHEFGFAVRGLARLLSRRRLWEEAEGHY